MIKNFDEKITPIWFMRQAGRYLPEYKEIRNNFNTFLDFCYSPDEIVKVTLQPIKRFDLDFAIIFSDILVLPDAIGWKIKFEENIGPVLEQFKSINDFNKFKEFDKANDKLEKVYQAINNTRQILEKDKKLIGFVGSPWTVASYMIEGRSKQDFSYTKKFVYENYDLTLKLIDFLTENTIKHLRKQILAGVDLIQLFDSWSSLISEHEYDDLVISPTKKIVNSIKSEFNNIKIIGFPRGSGLLYEKYINETKVDIICADQFVPINLMKQWKNNLIVQGNFDPIVLLTNEKIIEKKLEYLMNNMYGKNFIFNLGHGILPTTPIKNVEYLINYVRSFRK